jgi:transcriptional regulator with XRE-family HTH domain
MLKDTMKLLRESKKLTKKQVADAIGITERAYITYEYGQRDVSTDTLQKLANFYGVTTDYLLGRETNKQIDYIQQLADEKGLDSSQRGILAAFCYMDDAGREKLLDSIEKIYNYKKSRREQEQTVKQSTTLGTIEDQMEEAAKTKEEASS